MNQLGTTRLYSKVILSESNLRFTGIAILSYKITSISRKHHIIYLTFSI